LVGSLVLARLSAAVLGCMQHHKPYARARNITLII
jgi:hypothetical protein